jgi:hypothetical protein
MSNKDEIEIERKEAYRKSMLKAHIGAYIKRGLNAGIPERYLRIGPDLFKKLLSKEYHGKDGIESITNFIYKKPFDLLKKPFIIIDGGKMKERKLAAFAIMFRLITCDQFAKFYDCRTIVHKLNTFDAKGVMYGSRRTDFADSLKKYNVLCISEFSSTTFKEKLEGGDFLDEIIDARFNSLSPTVVTFQDPLNSVNALKDLTCGKYLNEMSHQEKLKENPSDDYLRIRVRSS